MAMQAQVHAIPNATTVNNSMDLDAAAQHLDTVHMYAVGGVGIAGTTTPGEIAYRRIMAAPRGKSIELLTRVWRTGTPEAMAYALTGLKRLSPELFRQFATEARSRKDRVTTARGSILSRSTLAAIADSIASGQTAP